MNDLETANYLRASADYLRTHGWWQGTTEGPGGSVCALGAIWGGTGEIHHRDEWYVKTQALGLLLEKVLGLQPMVLGLPSLAVWNDMPGRSEGEVLDLFESTALALEVRHLSHETQAPLEVVVTERLTEPVLA